MQRAQVPAPSPPPRAPHCRRVAHVSCLFSYLLTRPRVGLADTVEWVIVERVGGLFGRHVHNNWPPNQKMCLWRFPPVGAQALPCAISRAAMSGASLIRISLAAVEVKESHWCSCIYTSLDSGNTGLTSQEGEKSGYRTWYAETAFCNSVQFLKIDRLTASAFHLLNKEAGRKSFVPSWYIQAIIFHVEACADTELEYRSHSCLNVDKKFPGGKTTGKKNQEGFKFFLSNYPFR